MAREPECQGNQNSTDARPTGAVDNGKNSLLDRRSYLKLTGATAASAVAATGLTSASENYDVIEVGAGETFQKDLSHGETWENVLIDITANGAGYRITATADNWVIRNVGVRGAWDYEPNSSPFVVSVDSAGATGLIENLYLGDGATVPDSGSSNPNGIYVHYRHAGDLEVNNIYIQGMPTNGFYGSDPANPKLDSGGGTVRVYDSYSSDNVNSGFRIGGDRSYCENCVAFRNSSRGMWTYFEHTELIDCDIGDNGVDIDVGSSSYPSVYADVTVTNTRYDTVELSTSGDELHGSSAGMQRERIPEGCPQSAEEAASGGSSNTSVEPEDSEELPETTLTITGQGEPTKYYVETTGEITPNPERGDVQSHDTIDGTTVSGWVTRPEHVDGYRFDGELLEVGFEQGAATVELDGEEIDPDDYNGESTLDNLLLVDGVGTSGGTRYEFAVSGAAEKSTESGATINGEDTIDSGRVTGAVAGWRDAFRFSGELEELTVDGLARVYVNGEQVDPSDYGEGQPHVLTVVGNGSPASYEVSVDGTIDRVLGDNSGATTLLSESTAEGSIERGVQRFRFSGVVSDFTFVDGSTHVYVDDERLDPDAVGEAELLPHAIVIDGSDTNSASSYSFTTDGDVITSNYRDATIDDEDAVEGMSVSGSVENGRDAYWFDGAITDFRLSGDASVDVEYDVRDQ